MIVSEKTLKISLTEEKSISKNMFLRNHKENHSKDKIIDIVSLEETKDNTKEKNMNKYHLDLYNARVVIKRYTALFALKISEEETIYGHAVVAAFLCI
jgi:hypothetical protein